MDTLTYDVHDFPEAARSELRRFAERKERSAPIHFTGCIELIKDMANQIIDEPKTGGWGAQSNGIFIQGVPSSAKSALTGQLKKIYGDDESVEVIGVEAEALNNPIRFVRAFHTSEKLLDAIRPSEFQVQADIGILRISGSWNPATRAAISALLERGEFVWSIIETMRI